ncbi:hypothetical protein AVEN_99522-1 [Araneus ventricosus]|uniref:Uncharacterized protein n=1 Tax=Araneus ventricosus TaxID=182803 RepID=A0A4Y2MV97_ARAVE|nr:hypothetical protein AVEN_99522-1 [Araneus ventricosus]
MILGFRNPSRFCAYPRRSEFHQNRGEHFSINSGFSGCRRSWSLYQHFTQRLKNFSWNMGCHKGKIDVHKIKKIIIVPHRERPPDIDGKRKVFATIKRLRCAVAPSNAKAAQLPVIKPELFNLNESVWKLRQTLQTLWNKIARLKKEEEVFRKTVFKFLLDQSHLVAYSELKRRFLHLFITDWLQYRKTTTQLQCAQLRLHSLGYI